MTKEALITFYTTDAHKDFGTHRINVHYHVSSDNTERWIVIFQVKKTASSEKEKYKLPASSQAELAAGFLDWLADIAVRSPQHEHMCNQVIQHINDFLPPIIIDQICANLPVNDTT